MTDEPITLSALMISREHEPNFIRAVLSNGRYHETDLRDEIGPLGVAMALQSIASAIEQEAREVYATDEAEKVQAARYRWLKSTNPIALAGIAFSERAACAIESTNIDVLVDAAMGVANPSTFPCCEEIEEYLGQNPDILWRDQWQEHGRTHGPYWIVQNYSEGMTVLSGIKHCPFCGAKLPEGGA